MRMFSVPMGQPPHRLLPFRLWKWGNVRRHFCLGLVKVVWYSTSSLLKWHTWRTSSRERSYNGRFGGGRHLESLPSLGLVFWTLQFGTSCLCREISYSTIWWCMCTMCDLQCFVEEIDYNVLNHPLGTGFVNSRLTKASIITFLSLVRTSFFLS